jgi:hypothetical protein
MDIQELKQHVVKAVALLKEYVWFRESRTYSFFVVLATAALIEAKSRYQTIAEESAIVELYGPPESGKNRTMESVDLLTTGGWGKIYTDSSAASLCRLLDGGDRPPILMLDEAEDADRSGQFSKFLRGGSRSRGSVGRVGRGGNQQDFALQGIKILATTRSVEKPALRSRCIMIKTEPCSEALPPLLLQDVRPRAASIHGGLKQVAVAIESKVWARYRSYSPPSWLRGRLYGISRLILATAAVLDEELGVEGYHDAVLGVLRADYADRVGGRQFEDRYCDLPAIFNVVLTAVTPASPDEPSVFFMADIYKHAGQLNGIYQDLGDHVFSGLIYRRGFIKRVCPRRRRAGAGADGNPIAVVELDVDHIRREVTRLEEVEKNLESFDQKTKPVE